MAKPRGAAAPAPEQVPSSPRHRHRYKANRTAKTARNAQRSENKARTALVLGGGAPNMALMAGAVAAFVQRGVTFDVVSASGAGSLAGLLWLAPKGQTPADALRSVVTMSISDAIYRHLPINYKVFQKPGTWADLWRDALSANPFFKVKPHDYEHSAPYALWTDWMALWAASLSPSGLNWNSWGLCAPTPFIEHIIDFDKIRHIKPYFYLNAYNVTKSLIDDFTKQEITPDHFRAALAFPFIYGPYKLNDQLYYEGAVVDCLNFKDLVELHTGLETIVVLDVLGSDTLIRAPRNIYQFVGVVDDHSAGQDCRRQSRSVRPQAQQRLAPGRRRQDRPAEARLRHSGRESGRGPRLDGIECNASFRHRLQFRAEILRRKRHQAERSRTARLIAPARARRPDRDLFRRARVVCS